MLEIKRMFANVPTGHQVLTTNGLEYDYVHYRHNPDGVASVIDNNHRFMPFAKRLDEDGKVLVSIRVWEFDIDRIEILDETTGEWHPMWSTDPDYTGGLSRWEHHLYMDFLAASDRGRKRQRGRISVKAKQEVLRSFDDEMHKLGIRLRGKRFALIEAEEKRAMELENAPRLESEKDQGVKYWQMTPGGEVRNDIPCPPPQDGTGGSSKKPKPQPQKRSEHYGTASTARLTRPQSSPSESQISGEFKFKRRRSNGGQ